MPKKTRMPASPLTKGKWPDLPRKQELGWMISILRQRFEADRFDCLMALQVMGRIAAYYWDGEEPLPEQDVAVPWWAVQALAIGFKVYEDSSGGLDPKNLGESLGLEGGGQGQRPKMDVALQLRRDIRIALRIALGAADGVKIDSLVRELAAETGLSDAQIRRIWSANRTRAHELAKTLSMCKSS